MDHHVLTALPGGQQLPLTMPAPAAPPAVLPAAPDPAQVAGAVDRYLALREFRARLYRCLTARPDACFELCDAILCADHAVTSLVQLSLVPEFRRGHGALYDALAAGQVDQEALAALLTGTLGRRELPARRQLFPPAREQLLDLRGLRRDPQRRPAAAPGPVHLIQRALGDMARELSDIDRSRAAASSIASGIPSSRRHTDTTSGPACSSTGRPTPCAQARSANSATASEDPGAKSESSGPGSDSDGTR